MIRGGGGVNPLKRCDIIFERSLNKNKPYLPLWFVKTGTHSSLCCASTVTVRQLGFVVEDSQHFQILFQFKYFNHLKDMMEIQLRY